MAETMDQPLRGRHALVTGGGRGIGAAIAGALLSRGASVTIAGRQMAVLDAAVRELQSLGKVDAWALDVTRPEDVAACQAAIEEKHGGIDVVVNNAGQAASAPLGKTDDALWQRMLDVNLSGTFYVTRAALPAMVERGWGRIINIASTAGLTGYGYTAAYCASKHGVVGMTRALALEVATKGVTVNAVCPGFTDTELLDEAIANIVAKTGRDAADARRQLAALNPQKRLVKPEEVAFAVICLCLPGSDAFNGQALAVAGGEVM